MDSSKIFFQFGEILDVGCGKGLFLVGFKKIGYDAYGIDADNKEVKILKRRGLSVFKCNMETDKLPFKNNFFDYIFVRYVTPFVKNTENFMKEIKRVLRREGLFFMIELDYSRNYKNYFNGPYKIKKKFNFESLKNILRSYNFEIIKSRIFQNIPCIWRYTIKAFDFIFPNSKSVLIIAKKKNS